MSNIVDTVEDRIQNAILTATENIVAPKIELAIRSINASFGRDATSVSANSERRERVGINASFENASENNDTLDVSNVNDETRHNIPDEVTELLVPETHFDRQAHTHHNNVGIKLTCLQWHTTLQNTATGSITSLPFNRSELFLSQERQWEHFLILCNWKAGWTYILSRLSLGLKSEDSWGLLNHHKTRSSWKRFGIRRQCSLCKVIIEGNLRETNFILFQFLEKNHCSSGRHILITMQLLSCPSLPVKSLWFCKGWLWQALAGHSCCFLIRKSWSWNHHKACCQFPKEKTMDPVNGLEVPIFEFTKECASWLHDTSCMPTQFCWMSI